jgi:NitT/TauT family transport system substrate-binding protein
MLQGQGIDLEYVSLPSSAGVQQQVAAGGVNIGTGGFVDPIRAIDKGGDLALLRTTTVPPPYQLMAKASIKTVADLRGKTISIGGAQDITRIYLERMLAPSEVKPSSYDKVYAGATAARFAALMSGAVDAALLTSPFNFRAASAGFVSLGVTADFVKDFPFTGISVNRSWGLAHQELLLRFLKAYQLAELWFEDPANRVEAVDLLANSSKSDRGDADRTYDFYRQIKAYDPVGALDPQQLGTLIGILKQLGQIEGDADFKRFYDPQLSTLAAKVH